MLRVSVSATIQHPVINKMEGIMWLSGIRNLVFAGILVASMVAALGFYAYRTPGNQYLATIEQRNNKSLTAVSLVARERIPGNMVTTAAKVDRQKMRKLTSFFALIPYLARQGKG